MIVEFICNRSGNKVRFSRADDIASMRKQDGYTEVINESETKSNAQVDTKQEGGQSAIGNSGESQIRKEDGSQDGKQETNVLKKRGRISRKQG